MRWLSCVFFLFVLLLPAVAIGQQVPQCPAPKDQATSQTPLSAIRIIASGDYYSDAAGTTTALADAMEKWNAVCGMNVPTLSMTTESDVVFSIEFKRGVFSTDPDDPDLCGFVPKPPAGSSLTSTTITIFENLRNGAPCSLSDYNLIIQHEIGHALGLEDCSTNFGINIMEGLGLFGPVKAADCQAIDDFWLSDEEPAPGSPDGDETNEDNQCVDECGPGGTTPIVISLLDERYELTSFSAGVVFDIDADGSLDQVAWTAGGSDDAFLVLDRNANGLIDDGSELFGGVTPQPPSVEPNGFAALAVFDAPDYGGDLDGYVTSADAVFGQLRCWVDANHNGVSDAGELLTLSDAGILFLDLAYGESRKVDDFGNEYRFWSLVGREHDIITMWDVILLHVEL